MRFTESHLAVFLFVLVAGCGRAEHPPLSEPEGPITLDRSSIRAAHESALEMKDSLEPGQRDEYRQAMSEVVRHVNEQAEGSPRYSRVVRQTMNELLDGKTAEEVIELGRHLRREREARELPTRATELQEHREQSLAEFVLLETQREQSAAFHDSLVDRYRFYFQDEPRQLRPAIEIEATNRTDQAIQRIQFRAAMYGPGHDIATASKTITHRMASGLGAGESDVWHFEPQSHGEWDELLRFADTFEFAIILTHVQGEDGTVLFDNFYSDSARHRARILQEQIREFDRQLAEIEASIDELQRLGYDVLEAGVLNPE